MQDTNLNFNGTLTCDMKHGLCVTFTEEIPRCADILASVLQHDILNGQGWSALVREHLCPHGWCDLHSTSVPREWWFWLGNRPALETVQQ